MSRHDGGTNFLAETRRDIEASGHTPDDIVFIGSTESGHACTWAEFEGMADFEYDQGFGAAFIAGDLRIVFSDGSDMHRGEYDGSEWWEFSEPFVAPTETHPIRTLFQPGDLWPTLEEQQREGGKYGPKAAGTRAGTRPATKEDK